MTSSPLGPPRRQAAGKDLIMQLWELLPCLYLWIDMKLQCRLCQESLMFITLSHTTTGQFTFYKVVACTRVKLDNLLLPFLAELGR